MSGAEGEQTRSRSSLKGRTEEATVVGLRMSSRFWADPPEVSANGSSDDSSNPSPESSWPPANVAPPKPILIWGTSATVYMASIKMQAM